MWGVRRPAPTVNALASCTSRPPKHAVDMVRPLWRTRGPPEDLAPLPMPGSVTSWGPCGLPPQPAWSGRRSDGLADHHQPDAVPVTAGPRVRGIGTNPTAVRATRGHRYRIRSPHCGEDAQRTQRPEGRSGGGGGRGSPFERGVAGLIVGTAEAYGTQD